MTHPPAGPSTPTPPPGPRSPMTASQRIDIYRRQNGSTRLTPRQLRRIDHKAARAAKRALAHA